MNPIKLELSHDILAKKIAEKISAEDKQIRKFQSFVKERFTNYSDRGSAKSALLDKEDLEYLGLYENQLILGIEEKKFLLESKKQIRSKQWKVRILLFLSASFIIGAGILAVYLSIQSSEISTLLQMREQRLSQRMQDLEKKNLELKDEIKQESEFQNKLTQTKKQIQQFEEDSKEMEKRIEEKNNSIKEADLVLKRDLNTRLQFLKKESAYSERWSGLQTEADWAMAKKKCSTLGLRLPSKLELEGVYANNPQLVAKWKLEKCCRYWTDETSSLDNAYDFDLGTGRMESLIRDNLLPFRCIR